MTSTPDPPPDEQRPPSVLDYAPPIRKTNSQWGCAFCCGIFAALFAVFFLLGGILGLFNPLKNIPWRERPEYRRYAVGWIVMGVICLLAAVRWIRAGRRGGRGFAVETPGECAPKASAAKQNI